jgi:hypothetical protein
MELSVFGFLTINKYVGVFCYISIIFQMCARPKFGKWLGCVAMDTADDWLVCIV